MPTFKHPSYCTTPNPIHSNHVTAPISNPPRCIKFSTHDCHSHSSFPPEYWLPIQLPLYSHQLCTSYKLWQNMAIYAETLVPTNDRIHWRNSSTLINMSMNFPGLIDAGFVVFFSQHDCRSVLPAPEIPSRLTHQPRYGFFRNKMSTNIWWLMNSSLVDKSISFFYRFAWLSK